MNGSLLHVGCGGDPLPEWAVGKYIETRLDISPDNNPHIVANMIDMGDIGEYDVIYCSHALEHLNSSDVKKALKEFHRVLKTPGHVVIMVPDLEDVKANNEVLFHAPCGPISGLDLIYGARNLVDKMPYMAHRTGFTTNTLRNEILEVGFKDAVMQRLPFHNLMAVAIK